jgi:hypothetical protein
MHTHNADDAHIYDNGCMLCDAQQSLRDYADGTAIYPPWVDQEADALATIRLLTLETPCT